MSAQKTTLWYQLGEYFGIANEKILMVRAIGDTVWFNVNGADYNCHVLRNGLLKKHSIRRSEY